MSQHRERGTFGGIVFGKRMQTLPLKGDPLHFATWTQDGMDQSKWSIPRYQLQTKESQNMIRPHWKVHGIWLHGVSLTLYAVHPCIPSDSSLLFGVFHEVYAGCSSPVRQESFQNPVWFRIGSILIIHRGYVVIVWIYWLPICIMVNDPSNNIIGSIHELGPLEVCGYCSWAYKDSPF